MFDLISYFYRGFAAFVSYYVNHPLYTPPGIVFGTVFEVLYSQR